VYLVYGAGAMGAVVGPLVLRPFLSDGSVTLAHTRDRAVVSRTGTLWYDTMLPANNTELNYLIVQQASRVNSSVAMSESRVSCLNFFTLIQYAFILFGAGGLPGAAMSLFFYIKERTDPNNAAYETIQKEPTTYKKLDYFFISIMFLYFVQGQGFVSSYSMFLTTYAVEGPLKLTLSKMTLMTSLYWLVFLIARLLPSIFPSSVKQLYILVGSYIGLMLGEIALLLSLRNEVSLWVASIATGFFCAISKPSGMAWAREIAPMTPAVTAVYVVGMTCGYILPAICGMLIANYGTDAFIHFSIISYIIQGVIIGIAIIISKRLHAC